MSSIKLVLRCDKINKNSGKAPLYLRVIKDRKTRFISLGQQLEPKFWDDDKQKVKKSYQNSARMNAFLAQKIAEAEQKVLEESQKNRNVSTRQLKTSIVGKEPPKFFEYAYKKLEMMFTYKKFSTSEHYRAALLKFEKFCGTKDIYFEDINTSFLKDYEHYLITKLQNSLVTVHFSFTVIKIFFNQAIKEEVIPISLNPLRHYTIKFKAATKDFLDEIQFEKLSNYKANHRTKQVALDMFIFSSYAGGLRFSDTISLKWEHYNKAEKRIAKTIQKTTRQHQVRLPEQAIAIIEKYYSDSVQPSDYIFPFIPENRDYSPSEFYYLKNLIGRKANNHLKHIGKELEIPFKLSFHVSRHTFATRALRKGMRMEYVSKVLDHSTIAQTQVYAKIVNSELDKAMDNIFAN